MRRLVVATVAAGALVLTGCGGLSTSSKIQPGLDVGAQPDNEVRVDANPVARGSSPEQVVSGFIRAAAASDDQYQVARSYLASSTAASWRPDTSVVVFTADSDVSVQQKTPDSVRAVVQAVARIDGDGRYHELSDGARSDVTFGMGKVDGEWRITELPKGFGTWLSVSDLDRLYDPFHVYFVSSVERRLVPDERWFPLGPGLATRLARALLAGVPDYLGGAVRTDVPPGTRLAVDSVTIDSGLARVDLSSPALSNDAGRRQNLGAQFYATLTQVPGVDRVALQLDGADLQIPGNETALDSLSALGFGSPAETTARPVLRTGTALAAIDPDLLADPDRRPQSQPGAPLPELQPGWAFIALSPDGGEVAAVGGDRAQLARWRGEDQVQSITPGTLLTRPTYDRRGVLWVAGVEKGTTRLWAVDTAADPAAAKPQVVQAPWLSGRAIVSQRVSPDGQRIAVISTAPNGKDPRLEVAGVQREPNGLPSRLASSLPLAPSLTLMRDAVWVDDSTLAVLGRKPSSEVIRPWFVPIGGPIAAGPDLKGALTITTVNGARGLVVTTDTHQVMLRAGNRWQRVGKATDLAVPAR